MVRFAVEMSTPLEDLEELSKKAEELGYHSILYGDSLNYYTLECWTALAIISSFTRSIRIGPSVTFSLYRHPALLARASATLDRFSRGRLDFRMGIGGRTMKRDSSNYGVPFPSYAERVSILDESMTLIKGLWTNQSFTFSGRYFTMTEAQQKIRPLQEPHPPITIAGQSRGVLDLVAKHANVWETGGLMPEEYRKRMESLGEICSMKGRREDEIEKSLEVTIGLSEKGEDVDDALRARLGTRLEEHEKVWTLLHGSPREVAKRLDDYLALGITRFSLYFINYRGSIFAQRADLLLEQMELFRDAVIPLLSP